MSLVCTWTHRIHPRILGAASRNFVTFRSPFPSPETEHPTNIHYFVHKRKQAFRWLFEMVCDNLNKNQWQCNAIYIHKVHGPTYRDGQEVSLPTPMVPVCQNPGFLAHGVVHTLYWDVSMTQIMNWKNSAPTKHPRYITTVWSWSERSPDYKRPHQRKKLLKLRLQRLMYQLQIKQLDLPFLKMVSIKVTSPKGHLYQHMSTFRLPLRRFPQMATSHQHVLHLR